MMDIFGHSWEQIQRAQRGGKLNDAIDISHPAANGPTDEDRALLALHGEAELQRMGYAGVLDRLRTGGLI